MTEQEYERRSSLTEEDIETCYKVINIVQDYYSDEHPFRTKNDFRRARYFIREFEDEIELESK